MSLPTEWTYTVETANPTTASIVIPAAAAGIRHVLTGLTARLVNNAGGLQAPFISVLDGATVIWRGTLATTAGAGVVVSDEMSLSSGALVGSPATAMTVNYNGTNAGLTERLTLTGYEQ